MSSSTFNFDRVLTRFFGGSAALPFSSFVPPIKQYVPPSLYGLTQIFTSNVYTLLGLQWIPDYPDNYL